MVGKISYSSFLSDVREIISLSEELKDKWEIQSCRNGSEEICYLVKRNVVHHLQGQGPEADEAEQKQADDTRRDSLANTDGVQSHGLNSEEGDLAGKPEEDMMVAPSSVNSSSAAFQAEYHIVFSPSYSVPVLYFTACNSDGRLLSLEEAWRMVPASYEERLKHERWTFLTQQEHPYLGRPFFQLHPCHTADLMEAVLSSNDSRNYVVTWLSSVGPVVGLNLPLVFASLCKR